MNERELVTKSTLTVWQQWLTELVRVRMNSGEIGRKIFPALLTDNTGFQVDEYRTRHVFSSDSLTEKCVIGVIFRHSMLEMHLTVGGQPMFETIQFPTRIAHLNTRLPNMNADTFSLQQDRTKQDKQPEAQENPSSGHEQLMSTDRQMCHHFLTSQLPTSGFGNSHSL